jgi:NADH-quinone oxidoreductase subunit E
LPRNALVLLSETLNLPLSQIYSVATFYNAFSLRPRGAHLVRVCMGTACHVRGAPHILNRLETQLNVHAGGTTRDRSVTLETVNCLGACALGPVVVTDGTYTGQMDISKTDRLIKTLTRARQEPLPVQEKTSPKMQESALSKTWEGASPKTWEGK